MRREADPDVYCPQSAIISEEEIQRSERRLARHRAKFEAAKQQKKIMALQQQQRQQRLWVVGGTALVVVLSLIWYKKQSQKGKRQRRRRGGDGGDLPGDLLLDEDDGFNGTEEELQQVFDEASKVARAFPDGMLDQSDQLMLYGLYKQAKGGDRSDDNAPSKLNVVACAKYDAWGKFKGLPEQFAMKKYCEVVYHFSTGGESAYSNGKDNDSADIVYDDDKHDDVDEDGCPVHDNADDFAGITTGLGIRPSTLSGVSEEKSQNESETDMPEVRLRNAAMANDVESLQEVIGGGCNIDDADELGLGALHYAADRGSIDCLKLLVEKGASAKAVDCDGIGVLQTALSASLDVESLRILLEAGADPDACDQDGDSPRMWVAEDGDTDVVDLFALFPAR